MECFRDKKLIYGLERVRNSKSTDFCFALSVNILGVLINKGESGLLG